MIRTETARVPTGDYRKAVTCSDGHTTYKDQMASPNAPFKCGQFKNGSTTEKCGKPVS